MDCPVLNPDVFKPKSYTKLAESTLKCLYSGFISTNFKDKINYFKAEISDKAMAALSLEVFLYNLDLFYYLVYFSL